MSDTLPDRNGADPTRPPDPAPPTSSPDTYRPPPADAAGLLALFGALPRRERVRFVAALIRDDVLPPWRVVG